MDGCSGWARGVVRLVFVGAGLAFGGAACGIGHDCTDIGCTSGASVEVAPASGVWQEGQYSLELTLDDRKETCSFSIPDDLPSQGSITSLDCGPSIRAELHPQAASADDFALSLALDSEPKAIDLRLSFDGTLLLSDNRTLSYTKSQPNAGCEPICRNAHVELTVEY